jgi:MSHA pilin protein MshC
MKSALRGFTLVELVIVLVIVGILGAVASARYFDSAVFDAAAYTDQTRSMLRYAQKIAVAQHRPVFVVFSNKRIALCFNFNSDPACSVANRVLAPAGANSGSRATVLQCAQSTWYCEGTPDNLAYALQGSSMGSMFFDALGRPFAAGDPVSGGASTFSDLVLRISGDGRNRDITISSETGYVY